MRRIEALVGPDALREINVERALLRDLVGALEATETRERRSSAPARSSRRTSGCATSWAALRAGDRDALIGRLAEAAGDVDGVAVVAAEVDGLDPGGASRAGAQGARPAPGAPGGDRRRQRRGRQGDARRGGDARGASIAASTAPAVLADAAVMVARRCRRQGPPRQRRRQAAGEGRRGRRRRSRPASRRSWPAARRAPGGSSGWISAMCGSASRSAIPIAGRGAARHGPGGAAARRAARDRATSSGTTTSRWSSSASRCPWTGPAVRRASHAASFADALRGVLDVRSCCTTSGSRRWRRSRAAPARVRAPRPACGHRRRGRPGHPAVLARRPAGPARQG